MDRWRKFQRLPWPERWMLIQALIMLPLTALAIQWCGFRRLHAALAFLAYKHHVPGRPHEQTSPYAYAIARMVRAAAWHGPYRANCLQQSLAIWWLLHRQGLASDLRFGVRKEAGRIEVHAWVEYLGRVLNDGDDVYHRFALFDQAIIPLQVTLSSSGR